MRRILRALIIALRMTLRGEKPPPPRYPHLTAWTAEALRKINTILQQAESAGWKLEERQSRKLRIEGRDLSVQTILAAAQHNLSEVYPRMLRSADSQALTVIYASNMEDIFRLARLRDSGLVKNEALQRLLAEFCAHLEAIPREEEAKP